MLFDLFGPLSSLGVLFSNQFSQLILTTPLGAIPIWDQYTDFLKWALNSLADIFSSGGLAIIAFTIIIKTLLLPLTVKSIRSSKNMQELAPKIKELQKKHGKDRQRVSQETMALYQQHGVNPMAGCLPMILQIPIFFGLYHAISNLSKSDTGLWHGGFLWLNSLGDADPYKILPILAGLFQFIQARMMRPAGQKVTDPQQQIMNTMMNFMPLMVVLFGWSFASGPVIYWVTQSVYSVVQQWLITGWGSFGEWFPFLPELPDHRRLGYQDPSKLKDVVVMSGEAGAVQQKGVSAWINRKMAEAQEQQAATQDARKGGTSAKKGTAATSSASKNGKASGSGTVVEDDGEVDEELVTTSVKKRSTNYQARTAGSKFGAGKVDIVANDGDEGGSDIIEAEVVTTASNATSTESGVRRTKPKKRPTS